MVFAFDFFEVLFILNYCSIKGNDWEEFVYIFHNSSNVIDVLYIVIQGIPAFRDFKIRDPRYFVILFQWKLAKKVDFWKFLKVRFLLVLFYN